MVATPATKYKVDAWYSGTTKVSTSATYSFTMPKRDYSLLAKFVYDEEYAYNGDDAGELLKVAVHNTLDLDVVVEGGFDLFLTEYPSIEGDRLAYLYPGDNVTVKVTPDEGRELATITLDGDKMTYTSKTEDKEDSAFDGTYTKVKTLTMEDIVNNMDA